MSRCLSVRLSSTFWLMFVFKFCNNGNYFVFTLTVKSRPLVSSQKTQYRPEESMTINTAALTDDLRKALPNACLFKGTF